MSWFLFAGRRCATAAYSRLGIGWLFAIALVPGILAGSVLLYEIYRSERTQLERGALQTARALSLAMDKDIAGIEGKLQMLASTPSLLTGNLPVFYEQAQAVLGKERLASAIVLIDQDGQQVINTLRPLGTTLPHTGHPELVRRTLQKGEPAVSDLYIGGVARRPFVAVEVPVRQNGRVTHALDMGIPAERLNELLAQQNLPSGWVATLLDSQGKVVARSQNVDLYIGQPAPQDLLTQTTIHHQGLIATPTLEGVPAFAAFVRSQSSGWTMVVGMTRDVLLTGLYRPVASAGLALAAFLLGGAILAGILTRHLRQALAKLEVAARTGETGNLDAAASLAGPREIVQLAKQFSEMQQARKRIEEHLRQSRQFSDDIINSLPGVFYTLDREGRFLRWNRKASEVSGYADSELERMQIPELFDQASAPLIQKGMIEAFTQGQSTTEAELLTKDGRRISYYFTGHRTSIGGQTYLVGLGVDITERKMAESKLIEQEFQFRQLSESLPQLVWTCDADGACDYVSPQWTAYTGMPAANHLGIGWLYTVHPEDRARTRAAWWAAHQNEHEYDRVFRLRRHDGSYRWFRNRAVPLTGSDGRILKWFGTSTDIDDLKQAQEASCLAMERLETALKAASVTAFSQDQQLRYTWIYNPLFADDPSQVLGKRDGDVLECAADAIRTDAIKREVMATGTGRRQEIVLQRQGMSRHFELVVDPLHSREGDIIGVTCAALDISERKANELLIRRSEESLRLALSAAGMSVFEYDLADGRLTNRGPGSLELGLPDNLLEDQLFERIHPEDLPGFVLALKTGPVTCPVFSHEYRFRLPNGSYRWMAYQAKTHFDSDGHPVQLRGIYWDVNERKQNETHLKRQAQRQVILREIAASLLLNWYDRATLARSVFDRIRTHLDADIGLYFRMDARHGSLDLVTSFGMTPEDTERLSSLGLGQGICGMVAASNRFSVLDSDQIAKDEQASLIRRMGIRAYACHPLMATNGVLLGTLSVGSRRRTAFTSEEIDFLRTIAYFVALSLERLQAKMEAERLNAELECRVEERTAELEATNKELQGFTYAASHDMKGPLGRINIFSSLLERNYRDRLEGDGLMFLSFIQRNAQRLTTLINDLLAHAQIEQSVLSLVPVDVQAVTRQVLEEMEDDIRDIGTVVRVSLPSVPISVQANQHGLIQVLRNLVSNAVKYSVGASRPTVEIGARIEWGICRIWVEDNGVGFDMVYHDKIFEIFRRLHTYDEFPGSGVGLALAKKAVDRMRGRIWAESAPGQGATFFLEFPTTANAMAPASCDTGDNFS